MTAATLSWPLFPMRPTPGVTLTAKNVLRLVRQVESAGYLPQPKLNGNRVLLRKVDGQIEAYNRHGSRYHFAVNSAEWQGLPDDTLLDGESWQGRFYPFEALQIEGQDLFRQCVTVRAAAACDLCRTLGHAFLFARPADKWLTLCRENLPHFEGIVAKRIGTPYIPLRKLTCTSWEWLKLKWR